MLVQRQTCYIFKTNPQQFRWWKGCSLRQTSTSFATTILVNVRFWSGWPKKKKKKRWCGTHNTEVKLLVLKENVNISLAVCSLFHFIVLLPHSYENISHNINSLSVCKSAHVLCMIHVCWHCGTCARRDLWLSVVDEGQPSWSFVLPPPSVSLHLWVGGHFHLHLLFLFCSVQLEEAQGGMLTLDGFAIQFE